MLSSSRTLLLALLATAAAGAAEARPAARPAPAAGCDRACLDGLVDRYLDAMATRAPASLPWAGVVRYSENSVPMMIGDGAWATVTAHAPAALRAADPATGQVVWMGEVEEHGQPGFLALRLKIEGRKIAEAEAVLRRKGGPPQYGDPQAYVHDPSFAEAEPAAGRLPRAAMVARVDGYLDALQGKPGARAAFDDGCSRQDNGVATTEGATADGGIAGCAAQLAAGVFKPIVRVRERRFPVVDEARGVVIAAGYFDLPARAAKAADGKGLSWAATYPYSVGFISAFKLRAGRIHRVETISGALPYLMPSAWSPAP